MKEMTIDKKLLEKSICDCQNDWSSYDLAGQV